MKLLISLCLLAFFCYLFFTNWFVDTTGPHYFYLVLSAIVVYFSSLYLSFQLLLLFRYQKVRQVFGSRITRRRIFYMLLLSVVVSEAMVLWLTRYYHLENYAVRQKVLVFATYKPNRAAADSEPSFPKIQYRTPAGEEIIKYLPLNSSYKRGECLWIEYSEEWPEIYRIIGRADSCR